MTTVVPEAFGLSQAQLIEVVTTADQLRRSVQQGAPQVTDGPVELHIALVQHRKALDSLEAVVARTGRWKAHADRLVAERLEALDDAELNATRLKDDYSSALEKNMHIRTQSLEQRVAHRKAVRFRDEVAEVHQYVTTLYRGLDGSRRDLDTRLRLISLQTQLEH